MKCGCVWGGQNERIEKDSKKKEVVKGSKLEKTLIGK